MADGNRTDLRVVKTKRALFEAMGTLLQTKPLDRITVSDLCETASIRRATFYAHFRDKEDFLEYCLAQKREAFESCCAQIDLRSDTFYQTAIRDMIHFLRENRALFQRSLSADAGGAMRLFTRQFTYAIDRMLAMDAVPDAQPVASAQVLAAFFAGAVIGVVRWYCEEEPEMSEEALVEQVSRVLSKCASVVIASPASDTAQSAAETKEEKS